VKEQHLESPVSAALAALCVVLGTCLFPATGAFGIWLLAALALMLLVSSALRNEETLLLSVLFISVGTLKYLRPELNRWPFHLLVPLAVYGAVAVGFPGLRKSVQWLRLGRLTSGTAMTAVAIVAVSVAGLMGWFLLAEPDLPALEGLPGDSSVPALILMGLTFAVINAAIEEAAFRGIIYQALEKTSGRIWIAIVLQAAAFGAIHYGEESVPGGLIGVAMTFVYGLMLGYLRHRSKGLLAPWAAHTAADAIVFGLVV